MCAVLVHYAGHIVLASCFQLIKFMQ